MMGARFGLASRQKAVNCKFGERTERWRKKTLLPRAHRGIPLVGTDRRLQFKSVEVGQAGLPAPKSMLAWVQVPCPLRPFSDGKIPPSFFLEDRRGRASQRVASSQAHCPARWRFTLAFLLYPPPHAHSHPQRPSLRGMDSACPLPVPPRSLRLSGTQRLDRAANVRLPTQRHA